MPKSCVVSHDMPINLKIVEEMHFPLFVKPNCSGSSLGISASCVCHSKDEVLLKTSELLDNFDEVIIEEYVKGIDVTNYLIGNTNSYLVNNIVTAELFDNSPYAIYGIEEKQNKKIQISYFKAHFCNKLYRSGYGHKIFKRNIRSCRC